MFIFFVLHVGNYGMHPCSGYMRSRICPIRRSTIEHSWKYWAHARSWVHYIFILQVRIFSIFSRFIYSINITNLNSFAGNKDHCTCNLEVYITLSYFIRNCMNILSFSLLPCCKETWSQKAIHVMHFTWFRYCRLHLAIQLSGNDIISWNMTFLLFM